MTFLSPWFLAGMAVAAVPLILHLLKREPEPRVKFAAVRLLRNAPVEHSEKHRLRELLLLALRVATLALLAIAFGRPFIRSGRAAGGGDVTIVALDTSYSLSAPGRFERARQLALQAIDRVPSGDRVGVVTFSDEAELVARPSVDRALAKSAVDEAVVGFGATRYRSALSTAAQQLDDPAGRGTIVVVTDLQENGWDAGDRAAVPEGARIDIADVGAMPANLAVTAVQALSDRVVATIRNAGPAREAHARLTVEGRPTVDAKVAMGPNQSADVVFAGAPGGVSASVAVDDPDGLQADNVRYALIGGTNRTSVAVVTGTGEVAREAFYVQQALGVQTPGGAAVYQVMPLSGAKLTAMAQSEIATQAAVLLLSTRGLERRGREVLSQYVHGGGGLFIAAGPDIDGDVVADVLGAGAPLRIVTVAGTKPSPRSLAPADVRHPIFRPFASNAATLGLVTFQIVARVGGEGCQTLARFTTGEVAFVDCPAGDGRALVIASDLDNRWNDFPLHATFVPFLHEAVRYLASAGVSASEYLVGDAPPGVRRTPGIVAIADGHNGISSPGSPGSRRVAVNVDVRESDPARLSTGDFQSAVTRLKDIGATEAKTEAREQEDRQHLWRYALLLMVLTMVVEGVVASRTV